MNDAFTPDLFTPPRARTSDPPTSHAAARSMADAASEQQSRILLALSDGGPGTVHDLAWRCIGLNEHQIGRRVSELAANGRIRECGLKAGPSGRMCRLWEIAA